MLQLVKSSAIVVMDTMANQLEVIKTSDFTLASTLLCLGFDILGIDKTNLKRVIFYYKRTSDLEVAIQDFRGDRVKVNPKDFVYAQREIKEQIYTDI